jgi:Na+-transporting NADH:ubiquinone oxidoreductase subunit NqrB
MVLIFLVFAFVLFCIAAFWRPPEPQTPWRWSLLAAGLAFWVLAELIGHIPLFGK